MKTILVMAAGIGSRYGGLKQIEPIGPGGETLLDYTLYDAIRAGFDRAVFIIRQDIRQDFEEIVVRRIMNHIPFTLVFQELNQMPEGWTVPPERVKPWGTTHAVLAACNEIHEPFAAVNADDFYGRDAIFTMGQHLDAMPDRPAKISMVGYQLKDTLSDHGTVARGVCRQKDGYLEHIQEDTGIGWSSDGTIVGSTGHYTGDEPVSMNLWGMNAAAFPFLMEEWKRFLSHGWDHPKSECLLPTTVQNLIGRGHVDVPVLPTHSRWFGVTYRDDLPSVRAEIRRLVDQGEYPEVLWR